MVRFSLNIKTCCLYVISEKQDPNLGKNFLHPQKYALPYTYDQARNQGERSPPRKIFAPPGKCVGHSLKILDIVEKIWAPLGKLFPSPGVPSWLRACL